MLSGSEVWYGLTQQDVEKLEKVDEVFLRTVLNCSRQVNKEMLYLKLGIMPIRYIIKSRRVLYLHHILRQNNVNSLLFQVFSAQLEQPKHKDWVTQVLLDLEHLNIKMELKEIEQESIDKFKKIVKEAVQSKALYYLNN